jgi:gamma-glutamyltranspeptidase/glutathione hydrolase
MPPRSVVHARRGMIASAHPLATGIGVGVLEAGGSAVDAAIAVNAALGFLEPVSCGVGGDLFAILWDAKERRIHALNASGRAPLLLRAEAIPAKPDGTIPLFSPWSWTVPGAVDGWFALHARFGRLPMARLLAPALRAAEEGEPVPRVIAASWAEQAEAFAAMPGFAATFLPGGRAPREGEVFANRALARTYRLLAEGGRAAFYEGPIAEGIAAFSHRAGGLLSEADLAANRPEWVEPISTTYRGWTLWELPPNGQGLAALEMANIVERFDLAALGRASPDLWHLLVEAKKLAYEDRARFIADPACGEVPVAWLASKAYAREQAARIDLARAARELLPRDPPFTTGDTTTLAAGDGEGNLVALIQSNYTGFGSGYAVEGFGFGLQNRGGQFDLRPGRPNSLAPGKRPFHTIIPALLGRGGEPRIAFGLMGGDMQAQGHVQVLVNLVDLGMDLQEAGDAGRFYHTGSSEPDGRAMREGGLLALEPAVPDPVRRELARRGHALRDAPTPLFGGYQAVARDPDTGVLSGASESRKDGCALGL